MAKDGTEQNRKVICHNVFISSVQCNLATPAPFQIIAVICQCQNRRVKLGKNSPILKFQYSKVIIKMETTVEDLNYDFNYNLFLAKTMLTNLPNFNGKNKIYLLPTMYNTFQRHRYLLWNVQLLLIS